MLADFEDQYYFHLFDMTINTKVSKMFNEC